MRTQHNGKLRRLECCNLVNFLRLHQRCTLGEELQAWVALRSQIVKVLVELCLHGRSQRPDMRRHEGFRALLTNLEDLAIDLPGRHRHLVLLAWLCNQVANLLIHF